MHKIFQKNFVRELMYFYNVQRSLSVAYFVYILTGTYSNFTLNSIFVELVCFLFFASVYTILCERS